MLLTVSRLLSQANHVDGAERKLPECRELNKIWKIQETTQSCVEVRKREKRKGQRERRGDGGCKIREDEVKRKKR